MTEEKKELEKQKPKERKEFKKKLGLKENEPLAKLGKDKRFKENKNIDLKTSYSHVNICKGCGKETMVHFDDGEEEFIACNHCGFEETIKDKYKDSLEKIYTKEELKRLETKLRVQKHRSKLKESEKDKKITISSEIYQKMDYERTMLNLTWNEYFIEKITKYI